MKPRTVSLVIVYIHLKTGLTVFQNLKLDMCPQDPDAPA